MKGIILLLHYTDPIINGAPKNNIIPTKYIGCFINPYDPVDTMFWSIGDYILTRWDTKLLSLNDLSNRKAEPINKIIPINSKANGKLTVQTNLCDLTA
jgi:hypothetical protein